MTTSLPRPRTRCGIARERANRTRARSSNALCTVANRSAGPPTRIVVNRASGSSRDVLTPIRRWMSVPTAMASNSVGRRHAAGPPRSTLDARSGRWQRLAPGSSQHQVRDRIGGPWPPEATGGRGHGGVACRVVEQVGGGEQRRGVEVGVLDEPRRAGLDELDRVRSLVAGRVRIGHDHQRQTEGRRLGERRRTGPSDDEVRRRERRQHVLAQERERSIALAHLGGQPLASGQGGRIRLVPGHVDDGDPLDQARQRGRDRSIEPAHGLGAPEDEHDPGAGRDPEPQPCRLAVDRTGVPDRGAGQVARASWRGAREGCTGPGERHRDDIGKARRRPDRATRDDVAVPQHDRDPER